MDYLALKFLMLYCYLLDCLIWVFQQSLKFSISKTVLSLLYWLALPLDCLFSINDAAIILWYLDWPWTVLFCFWGVICIKFMPLICRIELFLVSFGQPLLFISIGHSLTLWCIFQNFLKLESLEFHKY